MNVCKSSSVGRFGIVAARIFHLVCSLVVLLIRWLCLVGMKRVTPLLSRPDDVFTEREDGVGGLLSCLVLQRRQTMLADIAGLRHPCRKENLKLALSRRQ